MPINIQGDIEGIIVLADIKGGKDFGKDCQVATKIVAKFISSQME